MKTYGVAEVQVCFRDVNTRWRWVTDLSLQQLNSGDGAHDTHWKERWVGLRASRAVLREWKVLQLLLSLYRLSSSPRIKKCLLMPITFSYLLIMEGIKTQCKWLPLSCQMLTEQKYLSNSPMLCCSNKTIKLLKIIVPSRWDPTVSSKRVNGIIHLTPTRYGWINLRNGTDNWQGGRGSSSLDWTRDRQCSIKRNLHASISHNLILTWIVRGEPSTGKCTWDLEVEGIGNNSKKIRYAQAFRKYIWGKGAARKT